ncbi:uncharacterized protein LOC123540646 [Mercenaria mercenaria]|uniref:uncharacterized protein LOC123540646 n=1 Tax=Mercenaria mercenaria TaxID=6596 RepID=UPI00234E71B6|nr:uncharacterized protein LOC123540646 [Mercenaria mercenaria]XP_045181794.2 uncharacterized protein LOC123540646 [Mercenaria mercenaria]
MRDSEATRISSFKTVKRPVVKKNEKKGFSFFSTSPKQKQTKLTLETLQALTPFHKGKDVVADAAREILLNRIRMDDSVHKLFFSDTVIDTRISEDDFRGFPIVKLSVAMVAEAISKCNDNLKFHCTVEKNNLENVLQEVYESVHWKKLGFSLYTKLYPSVVRDEKFNVCLQDFIDDNGPEWAERMIERMTEPSWTMNWVQKIVRGQVTEEDYNAEMNALFVKLHLLDPQSVIPTYHLLNHIKALPECNLELATRNYLGGPLDCAVFTDNVKLAIAKETHPMNVSKLSLDEIELFYGLEVEEFILSDVRDLGVWNGRRPNNKKQSKFQDRCKIM